jgi:hypothetical protein
MGIAPRTILLELQTIRMELFVLGGGIVTAFALGASHSNLVAHLLFSLTLSTVSESLDVTSAWVALRSPHLNFHPVPGLCRSKPATQPFDYGMSFTR